ncbi:coiled-coil domain-containing protein 12-like isoform 1 [Aphelenchoides avenae]|nr:coiled-coil domain-containing protein 12-like isoform 1 [Aphelenchus avenae]
MTDTEDTTSEQLSELELIAKQRKQRLQQLRKGAKPKDDERSEEEVVPLAFRSYKPIDTSIGESAAQLGAKVDLAVVEEKVRDEIQDTHTTKINDNLDLSTLAPRKVDWDLKRGVQEKLDKLERKTQSAIAQIIRDRLQAGDKELLASAVSSATTADMTRYS